MNDDNLHVLDGAQEGVEELTLGGLCALEDKVLGRLDCVKKRVVLIAWCWQDEDVVGRLEMSSHDRRDVRPWAKRCCLGGKIVCWERVYGLFLLLCFHGNKKVRTGCRKVDFKRQRTREV
jgi:hypothetical protein